jgi:hypothetical protein
MHFSVRGSREVADVNAEGHSPKRGAKKAKEVVKDPKIVSTFLLDSVFDAIFQLRSCDTRLYGLCTPTFSVGAGTITGALPRRRRSWITSLNTETQIHSTVRCELEAAGPKTQRSPPAGWATYEILLVPLREVRRRHIAHMSTDRQSPPEHLCKSFHSLPLRACT